MKLLDDEPICRGDAGDCAYQIMEIIPLIMRVVAQESSRQQPADISMHQFRALAFLHHNKGTALSEMAHHAGLTLPTMSKRIDGLVSKGLVKREISPTDRRCVILSLTRSGHAAFNSVHRRVLARLSEVLSGLSESEREAILQAMLSLRRVFSPGAQKKVGQNRELLRIQNV